MTYRRNNTFVIGRSNNWKELIFKEALMIKTPRSYFNTGLRASKELQLF